MIRGSTPTHTFNIRFSTAMIEKLSIAYAQNGTVVLKKTEKDCSLSEKSITVKLTQEETLRFSAYTNVEIQIKVLTTGSDVPISAIKYASCGRVLDEEVLV